MRNVLGLLRIVLYLAAVAFSMTVPWHAVDALAQTTDWSTLIQAAKPAVVYIETDKGRGSGTIVSPDGYILTAAHVISGANRITVWVEESGQYSAVLAAADYAMDVAVLKIPASGLTWLALGDSDKAMYDQDVRALGYPWQGAGRGFVASAATIDGFRTRDTTELIQFTAVVNPGNSGGTLIGESGEIIGVVSELWSQAQFPEAPPTAFALAVAINTARQIIPHGALSSGPSPVQPMGSTQSTAPIIRVPQDQPTIAAAVRAVSEGGEINLSSATYKEDVTITSGLSVRGQTGTVIEGTVLVSGTKNVSIAGVEIKGRIELRDSSLVSLESVVVRGSVTAESSSLSIQSCVVQRSLDTAILIALGSRLTVLGSQVFDSAGSGIAITSGSEALVQGTSVHGSGGDGVLVANSELTLVECVVSDNGAYGIVADAASEVGGTGNLLLRNMAGATSGEIQPGSLPGAPRSLAISPSFWTSGPCEILWGGSSGTFAVVAAWYRFGAPPAAAEDGQRSDENPISAAADREGGQRLYIWLEDAAGRKGWETCASATTYSDRTAPSISEFAIDIPSGVGSSLAVPLRIQGDDPNGSGVVSMRFSNDGHTWSPWEAYAQRRADWSLSDYGGSGGVGPKTVWAQVRDGVGRTSSAKSANVLIALSQPPGPPQSLQVKPSGWSSSSRFSVAWEAPAHPAPIVAVWYKLGGPPSGKDDGIRTAMNPFTVEATQEGGQELYVWAEDEAGWVGYESPAVASLPLDRTAPTGRLSFATANSQYVSGMGGYVTADGIYIGLLLQGTDQAGNGEGAGISSMRFSNDGVRWTSWEDYAPARKAPWDLSAYGGEPFLGPVQVFVELRDGAGNVGAASVSVPVESATLPQEHIDAVCAVAYSPDGLILASADGGHGVILWSASSGCLLRSISTETNKMVSRLLFSPDGQRLAIIYHFSVAIHAVTNGQKLVELELGSKGFRPNNGVWSPDGKLISLMASDGSVIQVNEANSGRLVRSLVLGLACTRDLGVGQFSRDGRYVVYSLDCTECCGQEEIQVLDVTTGKVARKIPAQIYTEVLALGPDGRLAAIDTAQGFEIWDTAAGRRVSVADSPNGMQEPVDVACFDTTGRFLAVSTWDSAAIWDTVEGRYTRTFVCHGDEWFRALAFSPDGSVLALGAGSSVVLQNLTAGRELYGGYSWGKVFASHDAARIAAFSGESCRTISIWAPLVPKSLGSLDYSTSIYAEYARAAFSPDSACLAVASMSSKTAQVQELRVDLWDIDTKVLLWTVTEEISSRGSLAEARVAFSSDARVLVVSLRDNTLWRWSADAGRLLGVQEDVSYESSLVTAADLIVSMEVTGSSCFVRMRDLPSGELLDSVPVPSDIGYLTSLTCSPDGLTMAGIYSRGIVLLDRLSGALRVCRSPSGQGSTGVLRSLQFSASGQYVLAAGEGVFIWDLASDSPPVGLPTSGYAGLSCNLADSRLVSIGATPRAAQGWTVWDIEELF